jgi:hypothetical protein
MMGFAMALKHIAKRLWRLSDPYQALFLNAG